MGREIHRKYHLQPSSYARRIERTRRTSIPPFRQEMN